MATIQISFRLLSLACVGGHMEVDCMWLKCETQRNLNFFKRGVVASHYVARFTYHAPKKKVKMLD